jgi:protein ImuB
LIRHIDEGTVRETFGPYVVSGGWWAREVQREYYFVRTAGGRALWMFYDRRRMGWFIQGEVE